jgi:cytochrome c peroxidase
LIPVILGVALLVAACGDRPKPALPDEPLIAGWSQAQVDTIRTLWLHSLPPLPPDPSNAVADNPQAAALGHRLFFETALSANGQVSCATCHQPANFFTDGLPLAQAIGTTRRGTPTIVGIAYSPWYYWDGRRDSLWAQALTPLEADVEHGADRSQLVHFVAGDPEYRAAYEGLFGPLPDLSDRTRFPEHAGPLGDPAARAAWELMDPADQAAVSRVFANLGKAIAAYERLILPGEAPFDRYVTSLLAGDEKGMVAALSEDQVAGLALFIGRANCIQCHNDPLFTNNSFQNIGLPDLDPDSVDVGRFSGVLQALNDPFNCLGEFSDAPPEACAELRFAKRDSQELMGAFKVPTLRNVAQTAPYMHTGQMADLAAVLAHYNTAPPTNMGHSELAPLNLTAQELAQLEAFLHSLTAQPDVDPALLGPPDPFVR